MEHVLGRLGCYQRSRKGNTSWCKIKISKVKRYFAILRECFLKKLQVRFFKIYLFIYLFIYFFFLNLFIFKFILFLYLWLCWVFIAVRGLSLVAVSGGYSSLRQAGFSLRWLLLLQSTGSRRTGFSSCGTWAQ